MIAEHKRHRENGCHHACIRNGVNIGLGILTGIRIATVIVPDLTSSARCKHASPHHRFASNRDITKINVERSPGCTHIRLRVATGRILVVQTRVYEETLSRACLKSDQMSSTCSTPQLKRTRLSLMPYSALFSGPCTSQHIMSITSSFSHHKILPITWLS
jgi:hypothetical protein